MVGANDPDGDRPSPYRGPQLEAAWFALGVAPTEDFRWRLGPTPGAR